MTEPRHDDLGEQLVSLNEQLERQVKFNKALEREVKLLTERCGQLERLLFSMNSIETSAQELVKLVQQLGK